MKSGGVKYVTTHHSLFQNAYAFTPDKVLIHTWNSGKWCTFTSSDLCHSNGIIHFAFVGMVFFFFFALLCFALVYAHNDGGHNINRYSFVPQSHCHLNNRKPINVMLPLPISCQFSSHLARKFIQYFSLAISLSIYLFVSLFFCLSF